ncbi:MAG: hypothetical protein HUK22_07245 [Thermoguttaceae bacterium]|nr:hypothetical protein [Thermoguttaceae bacterium]
MKTFLIVALVAAAVSFVGCKKARTPDGMPDLRPCAIKIEQEGKALGGATVTLVAKEGTPDYSSSGTTDVFGNAKILTQGKYPGVPDGEYIVVVNKIEIDRFEELQQSVVNGEKFPETELPIYTYVDEKYGSAETSGLELTVSGKTGATFDVGPAIKVQCDVYEVGGSGGD